MWQVDPDELRKFQGSGGTPFTMFVDELLRAQAAISGVELSAIHTNVVVNKRDGGVDTAIDESFEDDSTGWFAVPTAWQYKAKRQGDVTDSELRSEVRKHYAVELVKRGYGYRFCICDDLTAMKKEEWEKLLDSEIQAIVPDAQPAMVIGAGDLADLVSSFAGLVIKHFRPNLSEATTLEIWGRQITDLTAVYVPVSDWDAVAETLAIHARLSEPCANPVFVINGDPGTGKTRFVYETVRSIVGDSGIVVYTSDDQYAVDLARQMSNHHKVHGILIADECSVQKRAELIDILKPLSDRARAIAINNTGQRLFTEDPVSVLSRMSDDHVTKVLEQNYGHVPPDARRLYANKSEGFIRLAADLCRQHEIIAATGQFESALGDIEQYLRTRLDEDQTRILAALSLFTKVGFKGDVKDELTELAEFSGIARPTLLQEITKIKDQISFVQQAGRYFYVTPDIVAQTFFLTGWSLYVNPDPGAFIENLSDTLGQSLHRRVSKHGGSGARETVADFFAHWASSLEPKALQDSRTVDRLVTLVDTDPETYFPVLGNLIENASDDELRAMGTGSYRGRWGSRRAVVWLAERLSAFQEFFGEAERILLGLARAENEPSISNNATGLWKDLFGVMLSGTSKPFHDRFDLLMQRLKSDDHAESSLAVSALSKVFGYRGSKGVGERVVAGRIVPEEWRPKTYGELWKCQKYALREIQKVAPDLSIEQRRSILNEATAELSSLLGAGLLEPIRDLVQALDLPLGDLGQLKNAAENYIIYRDKSDDKKSKKYVNEIIVWSETLLVDSPDGRLIDLISKDTWHYLHEDARESWEADVQDLAKAILQEPDLLERNLGWLGSNDAKSAAFFGVELARVDKFATLLNLILDDAAESGSWALAAGYTQEFASVNPKHHKELVEKVHNIGRADTELGYRLVVAAGDPLDPVAWTIPLVQDGTFTIDKLSTFLFGVGRREATVEELRSILETICDSLDKDKSAVVPSPVLRGLGYIATHYSDTRRNEILADPSVVSIAQQILLRTTQNTGGQGYEWNEAVRFFAKNDDAAVARLSMAALIGQNYGADEYAEKLLAELAGRSPDLVLAEFEAVMKTGDDWIFQVRTYRELLSAIPLDAMKQWLKKNGATAAEFIARHLPSPYIENGKPIVPAITDYILSEFDDNNHVFNNFSAGVFSLRTTVGSIADQQKKDAEFLRQFLNYPNRRIRQWAQQEVRSSKHVAELWGERDAERDLD